ncbi:TraR/DksA C4-type zinc finger protein [Pseudomonas viridiflava]|uniref:TraR/DksA C4-type zinc finger protein n=1 Tax=Pseudomonas viridiflava TaxID=33069 RepID=UPI00177A92C4|nr:TraR/DksA C4-type zinc finger protein [Pseudomonas viridiflava]MBD8186186.1 TraR/DksA C4-type zinc finger protein [Pseudomonas viridiflava]
MADDIDRATEQAQYLLDVALFRQRRVPTSMVSAHFCEDCDDPIPEPRRAAIQGCETCIHCQSLREQRR